MNGLRKALKWAWTNKRKVACFVLCEIAVPGFTAMAVSYLALKYGRRVSGKTR